ncbi:MAG TPA: SAM-dependent methyltransferase [Amycolatopsis sp.]|nr:SAM-dependent methyltransferase [Amycolatopsis sp.]
MDSTEYDRHRAILNNSLNKPHVARVYDYYLRGESDNNWTIDRDFAQEMLRLLPEARIAARENRGFLRRAVRLLRQQGIRQFVDIGSGLPSAGSVHEIADEFGNDANVVYIDNDPVALAHASILLTDTADPSRHHALGASFFDMDGLWDKVVDSGFINPDEPVGLLTLALLHFMPPDSKPSPTEAIAYYREVLPPGSALILSHCTNEGTTERINAFAERYERATSPLFLRSKQEITELFGDFKLVDPGVTWIPEWRREFAAEGEITYASAPEDSLILGGVGVKGK